MERQAGEETKGRLNGKRALVTGAASGIGRAIAEVFSREGAIVVVVDIDSEKGLETVNGIKEKGAQASFVKVDVSNLGEVQHADASMVELYGGIDILVNDAAVFVFKGIEEASKEDWLKVLGVNVVGYSNCIQAVIPYMKEKGGSIVNISSVSGVVAQKNFATYNTSKSAELGISRSAAKDLAKYNIRVNAILPALIRTQATDEHIRSQNLDTEQALQDMGKISMLGRMGSPRDVAYAALFLASDESSFVTASELYVDGGAAVNFDR